jgi:hypothetical protein
MDLQFNTDNQIAGDAAMEARAQEIVDGALSRFASRLTRVELHLADENSPAKGGSADIRCTLEARPEGLRPSPSRTTTPTPTPRCGARRRSSSARSRPSSASSTPGAETVTKGLHWRRSVLYFVYALPACAPLPPRRAAGARRRSDRVGHLRPPGGHAAPARGRIRRGAAGLGAARTRVGDGGLVGAGDRRMDDGPDLRRRPLLHRGVRRELGGTATARITGTLPTECSRTL